MKPEKTMTESVIQDSKEQLLANYQEILVSNPEDPAVLHKLAELYYQQGKLEESISYYRRLWQVENSQKAILCFQLGQSQKQAGQLEEAITSYLDAIRQSPETFDYYHRLGETLVNFNQPHQWEKTIALYQQIISLKPDIVWVYHFLGDALRNTQEWEGAFQAYRKAISLKPDFFWSYLFLGDCAKELQQWEEVIKAYQQALEIKPEVTYLHDNIGEAYYQLGKKYIEQNQPEKALECYQKAVKKRPNHELDYYDLREMIASLFYDLALNKGELGELSEGVAWIQKVSEIVSESKIYEYLWCGLNNMGHLDESSLYCQKNIDKDAVFLYFSKKNTSKILVLDSLSNEDAEFITQAGLSLPSLELIRQDEQSLEEIYINKFSPGLEEPLRLSKLTTRTSNYKSGGYRFPPCHFQQSIIETGYIYSLCPFTGRILRSNQSFFLVDQGQPNYHFRFVGKEVFYVMVDYNVRLSIYIPKLDLILVLRSADSHRGFKFQHFVNFLKINLVTYWKEVNLYISTENKKTVGVWGVLPSLGHYLWNELTGIKYLIDNGILMKAERLVIGSYEYFNVGDTFPEVSEDRIVRFDNQTFFTDMLNNNYFGTMVTEIPITEELIDRVYHGALKKCSESCLKEVREAKQHFPLIWIAIRTNVRRWLSQLEGTANIIRELHQEYPNMAVVFDGWSRTEKEDSHSEIMILKERELVQQIESLIPTNITTYNIVGAMTYEKVVWSKEIDTYIVTIGSPTTYTTWIGNKPGVVHGNKFFYGDWLKDHLLAREQVVMPVFVPIEYVEHQGDGIMCNYDFDWRLIYNEVVKLLKNINPER